MEHYWEQDALKVILWIVDAILCLPRMLLSVIYVILKFVPYLLIVVAFPFVLLHVLVLIPVYVLAPIARSVRILSPLMFVLALPILIIGEFATFMGPRDERFMGMTTREKMQEFELFRSYPRKERF